MTPKLRDNTNDDHIWLNIVDRNHNEYRLPKRMDGYVVIDVGAHIGAFSYACIERGAQKVYAFEPNLSSFSLLTENLSRYVESNRAYIERAAVWRSDEPMIDILYLSRMTEIDERINSGSPSVIKGEPAERVPAISLDSILDWIQSRDNPKKVLLKLDCEGSEWPILFTSSLLEAVVDEIVGEYHAFELPFELHGKTKYDIGDLISFLDKKGYSVDAFVHEGQNVLGMFFAKRLELRNNDRTI